MCQDLLLKNGLKFMIKQRNCSPNKEIRIKASMLRSDLCNYSDACIVVNKIITVTDLVGLVDHITLIKN